MIVFPVMQFKAVKERPNIFSLKRHAEFVSSEQNNISNVHYTVIKHQMDISMLYTFRGTQVEELAGEFESLMTLTTN